MTKYTTYLPQHLAADLQGPLCSGGYIFVVVDYYSIFFEMEFTKSITTAKIVPLMSQMFVTHGLPCSLRTDNGVQFISDRFKGYFAKKKTVLNIDEPHTFMVTGQWRSWKEELRYSETLTYCTSGGS